MVMGFVPKAFQLAKNLKSACPFLLLYSKHHTDDNEKISHNIDIVDIDNWRTVARRRRQLVIANPPGPGFEKTDFGF